MCHIAQRPEGTFELPIASAPHVYFLKFTRVAIAAILPVESHMFTSGTFNKKKSNETNKIKVQRETGELRAYSKRTNKRAMA